MPMNGEKGQSCILLFFVTLHPSISLHILLVSCTYGNIRLIPPILVKFYGYRGCGFKILSRLLISLYLPLHWN